ncbi:MAG TPA: tRNA (cytidine(34)-2'-O)-methyltransferase [Bacteriovoracaceae bacterium]|nr:tRNA (cytidine(34)-2'-O)-methyltransferase [Bacteriovoracaceae bacterium]
MENKTRFKIVLFAPEIPGNTGSIGRTCVALNLELILIKPYGFSLDEKAVRRAGLDYWKHVKLREFESWQDFIEKENLQREKLIFLENIGEKLYYEAPYQEDCYLVFGRETSGFPKELEREYQDCMFKLPMYSEHIRSLNLSNVATTVAYECLRHLL